MTSRVRCGVKRAIVLGEGRPLVVPGARPAAYSPSDMTPSIDLSLGFPTSTARDRVMSVYAPAYDEHATGAQLHLQRYGNGDSYRRERWCATLLLRAITAELDDPRPDGLDISWLDARDAIERA